MNCATRAVIPALCAAIVLAGCGGSTSPNAAVAGDYAATTRTGATLT